MEAGFKPLPRHAVPWLRAWLPALAAGRAAEATPMALLLPAPAPAPVPVSGPAPVLARLAACDHQARRLHQRQAALLAGPRTATRRLAAGRLLLTALSLTPTAPEAPAEATALAVRRRWLARWLEAATDALAAEAVAGPVAAALLAARRRACLHEAACLRAWLASEPPPEGIH